MADKQVPTSALCDMAWALGKEDGETTYKAWQYDRDPIIFNPDSVQKVCDFVGDEGKYVMSSYNSGFQAGANWASQV